MMVESTFRKNFDSDLSASTNRFHPLIARPPSAPWCDKESIKSPKLELGLNCVPQQKDAPMCWCQGPHHLGPDRFQPGKNYWANW